MKTKTLLSTLLTSFIAFYASGIFAQCTAGFTNTISGSTVTFTNTCSGAITPFYFWNFGDGNYSSAANPANTYNYNGTYIVCLQYSGDSLNQPGCYDSFCDTIIITGGVNPPCNASFTAYPDSGNTMIYFYNQSQYNVQWQWDFGDGNTSTLQNPVHQYSVNNTYTVCLTTITTLGDTCTYCKTVNSTPCSQLLNASFTHSFSGNPVSFTSTCSGAPNPSYYWDFGDGNSSALQNPVNIFPYNGIFNVCFTYSDSGGWCDSTICDTVLITNASNPPCNLSVSHSYDSIPTTQIYFNWNSSIQPTQWFWDFGDGSTSTQQNPSHIYTTSGSYSVCLSIVRSFYGDTCTACDTVNILIPNILRGTVFSDANANCVKDGGDNSLANWIVQAQNISSQINYYGVAASNGNYSVVVPSGNYVVSLMPLNNYWNQVCPVSPSTYTLSVTQQDTINNLNFGMQAIVSCADLSANTGAGNQRRCFNNNYYVVQYSNNGTIAASNVLLKVDFDNPLGRIIPLSSTLPWDSISGTEYFWKLGTLNAGQSASFTLTDSISCNTVLGDTLTTAVLITPQAGDCNPGNNHMEATEVVMGSYDPNEKLATTTTNKIEITQGFILATDTIDYEIGFQNTGTDTAFTVAIYDTLDSDLNILSVISGVSTHAYTFDILGTNVLKWTFNNILLPDSNVNEPASHGFVKFRILQQPNNPLGTVITNSAGIVFDFNVPVITDTVVLTVGTPTGIEDIKGEENSIGIYPNPSGGAFTLLFEFGTTATLNVMNVLGEVIYSEQIKNALRKQVDLNNISNGIYFIQLKTKETSLTKKLVIDK